jgi:hypothetical protein
MIPGVLKHGLYFVGRALSRLIWAGAVGWLLLVYNGTPAVPDQSWELYGVFLLAGMIGVVAHELGHLLACLAAGAEVRAFRLGSDRGAIRFRVRTVQVSLGWPYRGRVEYEGALSVGRRAVITLAGPLMDLALAGLVLVSMMAAAPGQRARSLMVAAALGLGADGLTNLMPFRTRSRRLSDGARLFELRSDVCTAQLRAAQKTAGRLFRAGRAMELLELHARLDVPAGRMSAAQAANLTAFEFDVALLAGLPDDAAQLAERRVSMILRHHDLGDAEPAACLTLALLRLRQGGPGSCAEAERLCGQALAIKGLPDSARRLTLVAVIVSRQARGLPYEDVLAMAATTFRAVGHSPEAMAAGIKAALNPEAMLGAFREGDPDARLGVGSIAAVLRRQDRIGELLELHAGFGVPTGRYAKEQVQSLHDVECNLLLVPGLSPEVIDEAANRVRWILDNYPFEAKEDPMPRPAVEHTLALARLRQGGFGEVEPLCASALSADIGPDARATVLATIALARRALSQPHADLLAEAVALSPDADLVAEAASLSPEALVADRGDGGSKLA